MFFSIKSTFKINIYLHKNNHCLKSVAKNVRNVIRKRIVISSKYDGKLKDVQCFRATCYAGTEDGTRRDTTGQDGTRRENRTLQP